jgi:rod shape-determining protein MreB
MVQGIVLTGGGALLHGLAARLAAETGMTVQVAEHPLQSVAIGSGQYLEQFNVLNGVLVSSMRR